MKVTTEVLDAIEQARKEGRVTEQGRPRLPFREYPKTRECPHCTTRTPSVERPWFRENCPHCCGKGVIPTKPAQPKTLCGRPKKAKPMVEPSVKLTITVPCVVVSEMNQREHWGKRYKRFKQQKLAFQATVAMHGILAYAGPWEVTITMTRIGGKPLDDDNLSMSFKGLRDAVAAWMQLDDGDERLTWQYAQEKGKLCGVRIEVSPG